jgi:hypothetical protein
MLLLIACASGHGSEPVALSTTATTPGPKCAPVKIAILHDKTESTSWTRTPTLTFDDLAPVIELCGQCGGELAFGLIRDQSNRSLVRLRLEAQPPEPQAAELPRNRFKAAQVKAEQERKRKEYEAQYDEWLGEMQARVAEFRAAVEPLLSSNADAGRTDIWGAAMRADSFLAEDDASWGQKTHRWAVFVSDGQANVQTPFAPMRSQAKVLGVNGSASLGVLERLNAMRFESPKAAFDFIIATETRKQ